MRTPRIAAAAGLLAVAAAAVAAAVPEGWHRTLDDGLRAAKGSGRPVLVVTVWPPKV